MPENLDFSRLVDWIEGRLTPEEAAVTAQAVAEADAETQETVAWLRTFNRVSEETTFLPPAAVHAQLVDHFKSWAAERKKNQPGLWQRLQAILSFDSGLQLSPAAARAFELETGQRQLIYNSDMGDITLFVQTRPFDDSLDLNGQIFPTNPEDVSFMTVQLLANETEVEAVLTNDLHEFSLTAVPAGSYTLIIRSHQAEIVINAFNLHS